MPSTVQPSAATHDGAGLFRLLADDTRLSLVRLLAESDRRAGELGTTLHMTSNALAYHLKQLRALGVLRERRSTADGRDVYYRLDQDRLRQLYAEAGDALHPGFSGFSTAQDEQPQAG